MRTKSLAWLAIVLSVLVFAGCTSTGTKEDTGAAVEEGTTGTSTSGVRDGGAWTGSPLEDPNSLLSVQTVYFDFDKSNIRSEFVDVLRAHAAYLISNPNLSISIEGHADERGSREYNIALGERRAMAVRRFLEAEGVNGSQLSTISYGEERPVALGHDEASWAQNRRGVLVY